MHRSSRRRRMPGSDRPTKRFTIPSKSPRPDQSPAFAPGVKMLIIRRTVQRDPDRVQQEMEQVFRSLMPQRPHVAPRQNPRWRPPVEVYETEGALIVSAEIAGINQNDLSVVIEHDVLSIRGERLDDRVGERRSYRETGIAYGPFGVDVYIP